jgi:DNA-binding MarR family transcriptional regulator
MPTKHAPARTITVEEYRELLARRLQADDVVGHDAAEHVLWAVGPAELRDVARLSGASRAAVSSALNTLERDGLVRRIRDSADRRLVRIQLTRHGRLALREAMREQGDREREWFSALAVADQQRLTGLLAVVADRKAPSSER